jgi:hypothetical protein
MPNHYDILGGKEMAAEAAFTDFSLIRPQGESFSNSLKDIRDLQRSDLDFLRKSVHDLFAAPIKPRVEIVPIDIKADITTKPATTFNIEATKKYIIEELSEFDLATINDPIEYAAIVGEIQKKLNEIILCPRSFFFTSNLERLRKPIHLVTKPIAYEEFSMLIPPAIW